MYFYMLYIQFVSENKRPFALEEGKWSLLGSIHHRPPQERREKRGWNTRFGSLLQSALLSSEWASIKHALEFWGCLMGHLLCLFSLVSVRMEILAPKWQCPSYPCTTFIDRRKQSSFKIAKDETQLRRPLETTLRKRILFFIRAKKEHVFIPLVLHQSKQPMNKISPVT